MWSSYLVSCAFSAQCSPRTSPADSFIPPDLDTWDFVWVRHDAARRPLHPPYDGSYRVLRRSDKNVVIDCNGKTDTIGIESVKPAYVDDSNHSSSQRCTPSQTVMPPPTGDSPPPVRRKDLVAKFTGWTGFAKNYAQVDETRLQTTLDHLKQWSKYWFLPSNVNKFNFIRVGGTSSPNHTVYRLTDIPLQEVDAQKDLNEWITTSLKPSLQCSKCLWLLPAGQRGSCRLRRANHGRLEKLTSERAAGRLEGKTHACGRYRPVKEGAVD
nr:unnamed protein product [Spirometra erinaceieuropaei]